MSNEFEEKYKQKCEEYDKLVQEYNEYMSMFKLI